MPEPDPVREQEDAAAAESARIGGQPSADEGTPDAVARPLAESGEGEAEGFEEAERELIEHASHGDQHAARRAIQDAPQDAEDARAAEAGEADQERSSERQEEVP